ncbi:hypothetical protein EC968_005171 [Mortierella alpina]|nr:hypothetical protein EC968_005171 [Mortierella alpina]
MEIQTLLNEIPEEALLDRMTAEAYLAFEDSCEMGTQRTDDEIVRMVTTTTDAEPDDTEEPSQLEEVKLRDPKVIMEALEDIARYWQRRAGRLSETDEDGIRKNDELYINTLRMLDTIAEDVKKTLSLQRECHFSE